MHPNGFYKYMKILHLDNHLLAVDKPAGLPSQPDSSGDESLVDQARAWLKHEFAKPGNVYVGLVHRLDRPTSGVILLARTDKAAGRMAEQFRSRSLEKIYLALVACHAEPKAEATLESWLKRGSNNSMTEVKANTDQAKPARLSYTTLARTDKTALLGVRLETGVKHQIRCQLAARGLPVIGDYRYGPFGQPAHPHQVANGKAILLHASRLSLTHPVRKEPLVIDAPLPEYWNTWINALPGDWNAQAEKTLWHQ